VGKRNAENVQVCTIKIIYEACRRKLKYSGRPKKCLNVTLFSFGEYDQNK